MIQNEDYQKPTKLRIFLTQNGLTVEDLHELCKDAYPDDPVGLDTLYRIVNGERIHTCNVYTITRICRALALTPNDVIEF